MVSLNSVSATKAIQDITYTAVASGVSGNDVSLHYISGGTKGQEEVTILGPGFTPNDPYHVVTVRIDPTPGTGSTANDIVAALNSPGSVSASVVRQGIEYRALTAGNIGNNQPVSYNAVAPSFFFYSNLGGIIFDCPANTTASQLITLLNNAGANTHLSYKLIGNGSEVQTPNVGGSNRLANGHGPEDLNSVLTYAITGTGANVQTQADSPAVSGSGQNLTGGETPGITY